MSTALLEVAEGELNSGEVAGVFVAALRDRAYGRAVSACAAWARLEQAARASGDRHLAVQAGAERALTLTWMGSLSGAGVLCELLLAELEELELEGATLAPPPLDRAVIDGWAGAWFSVAGLHRLRAEQLRRSGDYAGAFEELEEANRRPDQRPHAALPLWGRVILSEALRLAGDFEGAFEVAAAAAARAGEPGIHPWIRVTARRAEARAVLALGELDEAIARFGRMARERDHRHADGRIACDLGIGEAHRRRGEQERAAAHLQRARATALAHGHVIGWIHAQLGLAELARVRGADAAEVNAIVGEVHDRLPLAEHPWLRLRAYAIAALSAPPARAEQLLDRAEDELPRFHRRSGDLELERDLVERCRDAVGSGERLEAIELDIL
ncbi:hypothetical protein [Conexibacter arvalis]|uniref:Tetratricopeptide (TPR) repeat protein n=1 Tax=Conexibacter arvalis TaxID=912552 RepID=A0A840IEU4_9ACTN|nr:hypothetical protein [Conexibacter arvalis]MBB4663349.1 tetratricopeptide (TPR) repeat protein [Conexibacter arvalis]